MSHDDSERIEYKGRFQLWWYSPSHQRLLVRRAKSDARPTRVDILFMGVAALQLPAAFDDISIRQVHPDELPRRPECGVLALERRTTYSIVGKQFEGYVVAEAVRTHESDLDYYDESPLTSDY